MTHLHAEGLSLDLPVIGARSFRTSLVNAPIGALLRRRSGTSTPRAGVIVRPLIDLTFRFEQGDRIGLIGHNGAGKSTLLRVLAGRYPPTAGRLDISGRTMPLLALGVGMDTDFSGYDNILINGLHLGLSRREIDARASDIAGFTELGDYLNLPVRTYSAGMMLRLAFAIATAGEPEVLLIDEVFGTGDAAFFLKAKRRLDGLIANAHIMVLATHDLGLLATYCTKACVMHHGRLVYFGPTADAIAAYHGCAGLAA